MKTISIITIILFFLSCSKMDKVNKVHPEMIGKWSHYSANNGFHHIYIYENGRGSQWGENDHGNNVDTQSRGWFIENDVLHFSKWQNHADEDVFIINQYPLQADSAIYLPYDTIDTGDWYMILNSRHYIKQ